MRLRNAAIAAASAVTLVLAIPGSAAASAGEFRYTVRDAGGEQTRWLLGPVSGTCLNLPGATEGEPAYAPKNRTTSSATVFSDVDCEGDTLHVLRPGAGASERLLLRSVVFA